MSPSIDRREFLLGAGAMLVAGRAVAQDSGRKYRIGLVVPMGLARLQPYRVALAEQLAKHGFVEGGNLEIDARVALESTHDDRETVRELLKRKPDALFTCLTWVTRAAQAETVAVPIVFAWVADPVAAGIVKSLAQPGGNVTGVTNRVGELLVKRLELAMELLPEAKRFAIVGGAFNPVWDAVFAGARQAAIARGVELLHMPLMASWDRAIADALSNGAQALLIFSLYALEPVSGDKIIGIAAERRVPAIHLDSAAAENGGLISLGTNLADDVRRGADLLAKILRGERPATLPVDQAARFEMVVNLGAAKALGLTIPRSILLRADRVIE